jgi:hypothetical protein
MSELHFADLLKHMETSGRWTAPYGVIEGEGVSRKSGRKYRTITFGVSRYLDAYLQYFNPKFIVVHGQGALAYKYEGVYRSIEELIKKFEEE